MGCIGLRCDSLADVDATIDKAMAVDDAPVVIDFTVGKDAMVWPMVAAGTSNDEIMFARDVRPTQAMTGPELIAAQGLIRRIPVGEGVLDAILRLVRGARPEESPIESVRRNLSWGPGPRAAQALLAGARARAFLDGRAAPLLDDVLALLPAALGHRLALGHAARAAGRTPRQAIAEAARRIA